MRPRTPRLGLVLLAAAAWTACGGDEGSGPSPPPRIQGPLVGQEIWIAYRTPQREGPGGRLAESPEAARALAEDLRRRIEAGEDIGALARQHSSAPYAMADGFSGVLPSDARHPDERDLALARAPVGGLTPIVSWRDGYWFARRVSPERGRALEAALRDLLRRRLSFRAVALQYVGSYPHNAYVTRSKEETVALARDLLRRLLAGEDFPALAAAHTEDAASAERGGLVLVRGPDGEPTRWVARWHADVPESVLDAVFRAPVGEVWPEVIVSPRGVFLVRVEEEREVEPPRPQ